METSLGTNEQCMAFTKPLPFPVLILIWKIGVSTRLLDDAMEHWHLPAQAVQINGMSFTKFLKDFFNHSF
jgi:hypothetical protein